MADPRYIFKVTGQMSQYGPWGIRLPDGPGQTDATLYFQTREAAEEYMREHPVEPYVVKNVSTARGREFWNHVESIAKQSRDNPPIPPTSAPWSEGGYAPPEE